MNKQALTEGGVLAALEELGAMQWGLVTTGQAKGVGVERLWLSRLTERGVTHRIRHGVYALPSATHGPDQELQAAWLVTDRNRALEERVMDHSDVVVSHISAANIHALGDLVETRHTFSTSRRRQTAQDDIHFYRRALAPENVVLKNGLPVTSVPRTISDLADLHIDFDHLAQVVKDALSKGQADFETLASHLNSSARTYGHDNGDEFMDALIEEAGLPATAESLLARNLSRALYPGLSQVFKGVESPQVFKALQTGINAMLPAVNVANAISEKAIAHILADVVKSQLADIDVSPWNELLGLASWTQDLASGLVPSPIADSSQARRIPEPDQISTAAKAQAREQQDEEETDDSESSTPTNKNQRTSSS